MDFTLILWIGGGFAVLLLIIGIATSVSSERSMVEERLGKYVEAEQAEQGRKKGPSPLTEWVNSKVEKSSLGDRISKELARADLKFKPGEYVAVMVIAAVGVGGIALYLTKMNFLIAALAAIAGTFLPRMYVKNQQSKRLQKFNEQLPDMLNLMVNGLRAGYSTLQAMEAVSKELPAPICDEFRRVVQEQQLGIPLERAMDNLLRRIPSDDLDLCLTAINVQREVGGNLAEILDTISFTIRERVRIKGEIRVLTTQVMYSGRFLSMLPVAVVGILYLLNPTYINEFFNESNNTPIPCGYIGLGVSGLLIVLGYVVMNKLGEVEI